MPRRGFFARGGGGDKGDKKSSKKQQKLQLKQQQQNQRQQQQHHQKRLSTSQASSSANTASDNNGNEPPSSLRGPRQTAPPHPESHSYDPRVQGVHYQPSSATPPHRSTPPGPPAAIASNDVLVDRLHQNNEHQSYEQQFAAYHQQHQTQSSSVSPNQPMQHQLQPHHHQQQYEENSVHSQQHFLQQQQQQQQHGTPPFASQQPYQGQTESPQQQQQQQYPAHIMAPSIPPQNMLAQNPTVDSAIDEIWRCETNDFRSASHAIQMLRLAIVAEWESQQQLGEGENDIGAAARNFAYDPSDTFLSLQGATLRFHARFELLMSRRWCWEDYATFGSRCVISR